MSVIEVIYNEKKKLFKLISRLLLVHVPRSDPCRSHHPGELSQRIVRRYPL